MKGDGKPLFGSNILFLLWRYFAKCKIRFFVRFLAFFACTFMHLSTRVIGGILIFTARYKRREALVLGQFRIIAADTEFDVVLILV